MFFRGEQATPGASFRVARSEPRTVLRRGRGSCPAALHSEGLFVVRQREQSPPRAGLERRHDQPATPEWLHAHEHRVSHQRVVRVEDLERSGSLDGDLGLLGIDRRELVAGVELCARDREHDRIDPGEDPADVRRGEPRPSSCPRDKCALDGLPAPPPSARSGGAGRRSRRLALPSLSFEELVAGFSAMLASSSSSRSETDTSSALRTTTSAVRSSGERR